MAARLAPDMKDFVYRVQSARDYVKAAAWLSGTDAAPNIQMPSKQMTKYAIDSGRRESVTEAQYAGAGERKVKLSMSGGKIIDANHYLRPEPAPGCRLKPNRLFDGRDWEKA